MTSWLRCKSLLRRCLPDQPPVPLREKLLSGLLAAAALVLMGLIKEGYPLAFNDILLASMGATAVLLYATPHSPLVQPSAVVVGHLLSALVGILAHHWVPAPFAVGLAVGGAIIAMHLFGCLHPPGGATALYAVSGGPLIWELDYDYVLRPVGMSAVLMVLIGVFLTSSPA